MLAHDLDVDDCPDFLSPPQRMSVMERARQVQGLAGRRVRRARPSESRAGTVVPLSVRTLTGGDVGIGRDVRPSYVQVGAGARMYGFTPRGGRALPSIRALDNMDTPLPFGTSRVPNVAEREEPTETGLGSTARCCGRRRHRQANSVRVCSPTSRRVASLRPRSAGLTALTPAQRTLVQTGSCRRCSLIHPLHVVVDCPVQNDALSGDR